MTATRFDAIAASPRPARARKAVMRAFWLRRIVRAAWLITKLVRREPVSFGLYAERFSLGIRSFRRDIASLRDAGLYIGPDPHFGYRLICFNPDADAG
jgi:predicted DNA-binding transcriptional regulator YafY